MYYYREISRDPLLPFFLHFFYHSRCYEIHTQIASHVFIYNKYTRKTKTQGMNIIFYYYIQFKCSLIAKIYVSEENKGGRKNKTFSTCLTNILKADTRYSGYNKESCLMFLTDNYINVFNQNRV